MKLPKLTSKDMRYENKYGYPLQRTDSDRYRLDEL